MDNSKRQYNKKSEYWKQFQKPEISVATASQGEVFEPEMCGDPFYVSQASVFTSTASDEYSRVESTSRSGSRKNRAAFQRTHDRFSSIRNGLLPYSYAMDGVNVR
jgi:hypothetical protein